jgi:hypothetical protein
MEREKPKECFATSTGLSETMTYTLFFRLELRNSNADIPFSASDNCSRTCQRKRESRKHTINTSK